MEDTDTICAISTPVGQGGIGIVRLSGPQAHNITKSIFRCRRQVTSFEPRTLYLGEIIDLHRRAPVDEVFVFFANAPGTYTREDMAEIHTHGGYAVQRKILSLVIESGARPAQAGEFTKRAFLNGRIDLLQAESVIDIIQSETDEELFSAMKSLNGMLSERIRAFQDGIREALAGIEAMIEFPDEELGLTLNRVTDPLQNVCTGIDELVESYYQGQGIRQGFQILITGKVNVGKSSLLNALLLKERAIVTDVPGTTRDLIEDTIYIGGMKMRLVDTAGIREPDNIVEEEGLRKVQTKIPESDLIIWVLDGSQPYDSDDERVFASIKDQPILPVVNKTDLPHKLDYNRIPQKCREPIEISALTHQGLNKLRQVMTAHFTSNENVQQNSLLLTNVRHRDVLQKTSEGIHRTILLAGQDEPLEIVAFELRESLNYLAEITGEVYNDQILEDIFSRFCIGK
ncbi:MAG TPA: tRNA uridine-5-carboxymethylaminomethyl(34) synthesis GTPase MnmE [Syntrophorhabdaceae bacterium]|nr:tRNA uridine-5-carboxymethylaminomethyl(34) synthesis GTPase MnmE [Syntrophorhabdaceae bacterium]